MKKATMFIDKPFPQWVKEEATSDNNNIISTCSDGAGQIPAWADPLPTGPVRCSGD